MRRLSWPRALDALRYPNFRLYFAGQAICTLGAWVQKVALAWLAYRITNSATLLGVVSFAALAPQLFVGPMVGAWVDKLDKRRTLIVVELLVIGHALLMAAILALGWASPPTLIGMALLLGVLSSFEGPLRLSLISSFLPAGAKALPSALALNAMLANGARFVGPPAAGYMLSLTTETVCFLVNAAACLPLVWSLAKIREVPQARATGTTSDVFIQGVRYLAHTPLLRNLILLLAVMNITASAYAVLLPIYAKEVFKGGAETLGLLWGAAGFGALFGTVVLACLHTVPRIRKTVLLCVALAGVALFFCGQASSLYAAYFWLVVLGFCIALANAGINISVQDLAPAEFKGRVISIFYATRFGFDAIGGLLAGVLAAAISASGTFVAESAVLLAALALLFCLHRRGGRAAAT